MTPDSIAFVLFGGAFLLFIGLYALGRLLGVALVPPANDNPSQAVPMERRDD